MSYETIKVEKDGPALVIRFDRPKQRNALSLKLVDEVMTALAEGEADASVSAIILTGGEKGFAAGADLTEAIEVKTASVDCAGMVCGRMTFQKIVQRDAPSSNAASSSSFGMARM